MIVIVKNNEVTQPEQYIDTVFTFKLSLHEQR